MSSITPVIWEARTAHDISAVFNLGDHAISSGVAGQTWATTAENWATEIAGHLASAMAKLGVGMEGINGTGAMVRLTGFAAWVGDVAAQAGLVAVAHDLHAASYTAATVTMPSLPEIAAVDAACAAGGTLGAAAGVGPEAAAGAQKAMDMQAAVTMDGYELANVPTMLAPVSFLQPPTIANAGGAIDAFLGATGNPITDAIGSAVQGVGQTISAVAGQTQGMVAPVTQTITSVGSQVVSAAGDVSSPVMSGLGSSPAAAELSPATNLSPLAAGGSAETAGAVSFDSTAVSWANMGPSPFAGTTGVVPANATAVAEPAAVRPAANNSAAFGQQRKLANEDQQEHDTPDYLKNFEHFADGRTIGPGVIGAFNEAESER